MTAKGDTYLTEEVIERVSSSLRSGNYLTTALKVAGVSHRHGNRWIAQGRSDIERGIVSIFSRFAEAVDLARAESEDALVDDLRRLGGKGDSKAIMFLLERRHPKRWGKPPTTKADDTLTPEQDAAIKAALSERPK